MKPGYFWLAYDWGNLTLSCEVCNIRFKRDYFPLKHEAQRASPVARDILTEEPLLIDPFQKEPSDFIAFDSWNILAIDDGEVGRTTIEGFGLNSTELDESRRDRYRSVGSILAAIEQLKLTGGNIPETAIQFLETAINAKGEYSAMIRDNFEERINRAIAEIG